jgi:hypothetical protein
MGSDWPHAESTPLPLDYLECLEGMDDVSRNHITHDNLDALVVA